MIILSVKVPKSALEIKVTRLCPFMPYKIFKYSASLLIDT